MTDENVITPTEEGRIILKAKEYEKVNAPAQKPSDWKATALQIAAKGVIGAAVGVAGGMVLVSVAAATAGAILSWTAFAEVLGIAGAAGGVSHGVVSSGNRKIK